MKKNKVASLAIAAVASVTLLAGAAYAWFTDVEASNVVNVQTGTINLDAITIGVAKPGNYLPGESVAVNITSTSGTKIKNSGSRRAIVKVSFNPTEGYLSYDPTSHPNNTAKQDWTDLDPTLKTNDYDVTGAVKIIKAARLKYIIDTKITTGGWLKSAQNGYDHFGMIEANSTKDIGGVTLDFLNELGGSAKPDTSRPWNTPLLTLGTTGLTASRQFEQGSNYKVKLQVTAVQASLPAVQDVFGTAAATQINTAFPAWFTTEVVNNTTT